MKSTQKAVVKPTKKTFVGNDLISEAKLDLWIKNRLNVLFEGAHGIGKTAIILNAWKKHGLRYAYFSGATMDPFIDFVGVPLAIHGKDGKQSIKLVRPQHLVDLDVQAIFIDEFNRTHKKVRNAVMELLQFKTINGKPISKDLRIVWAAVNPEDDDATYDVDRLDPAQRDRFHVQMKIPYQCSAEFFVHKFGKQQGETAVQFWNQLPEAVQKIVSPRRMEYALELFNAGGDVRDALPVEANAGKLQKLLRGKGYEEIEPLLKDAEKAKEFFADEQNYAFYHQDVLKQKKYQRLLDAFPPEKIASLLGKKSAFKIVAGHIRRSIVTGNGWQYKAIVEPMATVGPNGFLQQWAKKMVALLNGATTGKVRTVKLPKGKTTDPILIRTLHAALNIPAGVDYKDLGLALKKEKHLNHIPPATMIKRRIQKHVVSWFQKRGFTITETSGGWAVAK